MSGVKSNRLLPMLAGIVVLLTLVVGSRSCSREPPLAPSMDVVPQAPTPDADTPADTINTLVANVSAMNSELSALRQDNEVLQQENRTLVEDRQQIEDQLFTRLKGLLSTESMQNSSTETAAAIKGLTSRVDALANRLGENRPAIAENSSAEQELPVGMGLEYPESADTTSPSWTSALSDRGQLPLVWITPLERTLASTTQPSDEDTLLTRFGNTATHAMNTARPQADSLVKTSAEVFDNELPVYTVPRNATLIGATSMTALIGRVPLQGQVQDPMPFKLITGKDNLAANGLRIPGIEGMIWSGTAIGDWTLSCVTGQLESVTFVFEDGTLRTLSSDDNSQESSNSDNNRELGWISDSRGIPCISGERKTNAASFLAQRLGVMALEVAGEAAAQAQTATLINNTGTATSLVSGDSGKFILGKTLSGGNEEVAAWLRERQSQSFDAIFVPAGVEMAIHVDRELPIDFETTGRKLQHDNLNKISSRYWQLYNAPDIPDSGLD